jgi:hypothetical protein
VIARHLVAPTLPAEVTEEMAAQPFSLTVAWPAYSTIAAEAEAEAEPVTS